MKATIEIIKGAPARSFRIGAGRPVTIGRSQDATINILEGAVSRLHCKLQFNGKVWILSDLDSRNGTWLGETRIKARAVCAGDIFSLGQRVFLRFRIEKGQPAKGVATPAPAPPPPPPPPRAKEAEAESCPFCGEAVIAGRSSAKGRDGKLHHQDCLSISGLMNREVGGVRIIERIGGIRPSHRLRAHQPSLNRHVLLYAFDCGLAGGDSFREKLLGEVRGVSKILHPKIIQIHDLVEEGAISLVVTEYFAGRSLREVLEKQAFVKVSMALSICCQIAEGLAHAESQGEFVDRLDTRDIYVDDSNQAKLDFFQPPVPRPQDVLATSYLAPELIQAGGLRSGGVRPPQEKRDASIRSSIYSLGAIFYHMLAGIPPHEGETVEEILPKILQKTPPSLSRVNLKVSPALARVVERAMNKDPAQRAPDFKALHLDLRKIVSPGI